MIALGGNALSPKSESGTIAQQFTHTQNSLKSVMHFVRAEYNICITHGNGPQVGAEISRNEIAAEQVPPLPLGVLVANTQGAMGYGKEQIKDLETTINNTDCQGVIIGTPIDLRRIIDIKHPSTRVTYDLDEIGHPTLDEILNPFLN